jgi:hypothetical protein
MSYDLGLWGIFDEEAKADLPPGGIGAELIEIVESLRLQGLVGEGIPGDLNGICYLMVGVSMRRTGRGVLRRVGERGSGGGVERDVYFFWRRKS